MKGTFSIKRRIKNTWCLLYTHTHTHTHTMEYYTTTKMNGILPFVETWTDMEGIMLTEISQREKDKYCNDITYMRNLKNKPAN